MGKLSVMLTPAGFSFSLAADNGLIVAATKGDCREGIRSVQDNAPLAPVEDQTARKVEPGGCPGFEIFRDTAGGVRLMAGNGKISAADQDCRSKSSRKTRHGFRAQQCRDGPDREKEGLCGKDDLREVHFRLSGFPEHGCPALHLYGKSLRVSEADKERRGSPVPENYGEEQASRQRNLQARESRSGLLPAGPSRKFQGRPCPRLPGGIRPA